MTETIRRLATPDAPRRDLTAEEIRSYREGGVVVAKGLFPESWLSRMERAMDRLVAHPTFLVRPSRRKSLGFRVISFSGKRMMIFGIGFLSHRRHGSRSRC